MSDDGIFEELADAADASARLTHARLDGDELERRYQRVREAASGAEFGRPRPPREARQEILDIWRAITTSSVRDELWIWGDGPVRDPDRDAEQLLCLLLPASQLSDLGLEHPDRMSGDVLAALAPLGDAHEIPRRIAALLLDYYAEHDDNGTPVFSGSVDSYAVSVTLSLAAISFVRIFRARTRGVAFLDKLRDLEERASARLTAALAGLLQTFDVTVFDADSPAGRALLSIVNQDRLPAPRVVAQLRAAWEPMLATFPEILIGADRDADLFECGWSGITSTVTALDAIEELFSERTRVLDLLNEQQQQLSRTLQPRYELTRSYWAGIATFGPGRRWPLEDVPWTTIDGESSDFSTLQVASLAVKDLTAWRGSEASLVRIGAVLTELAYRARLARRSAHHELEILLPHPEFTPLLLRRVADLAGLVPDVREREKLLALVDEVRDKMPTGRSWHTTVTVVRALVAISALRPRTALDEHAAEILSQAEQLYDRQLLDRGESMRDQLQLIQARLHRAREILSDKPGTATVLATEALQRLDALAADRESQF